MACMTAADISGIFDEFGATATYTPSGGVAVSTTVMVNPDINFFGGEIEVARDDDVLVFLRSAVNRPARSASIVITDEDSPHYGSTFIVQELVPDKRKTFTIAVYVEKENA